MLRFRISVRGGGLAGAVGAGVVLIAGGAFAQSPIGSATTVQNNVLGHTGGEIFSIHRGDGVFLDQLVQTQTNSKAKFVFLDLTNMSVGPDSIVKLDQFVYSGNGKAQTVSINATKGAFRFFSGSSEHRAYKVTTPQAVIGVRGTTYDVRIANGQTYIKLQEGAVTACVRNGSICRDLDRPGESLIVSDNGIEGPLPPSRSQWDFGNLCGGGASDLCNKTTRFAMNAPPPPPPGGNSAPPRGPRHTGPGFIPPVRSAGLPPAVDTTPPVYVPPRGPGLPPVVILDPPRGPHYPPKWPPHRPPHKPPHTPPGTKPPTKPPVEGKPRPGTEGRPPIIRSAGSKYRPWQGRGPVRTQTARTMPRWSRTGGMQTGPRAYQGPRMMNGPRMGGSFNRSFGGMGNTRIAGPRMASPRMAGPRMAGPRMTGPRMAGSIRGGGFRFGR